jgi:catechol 2,3-dioxygenase-like lactoylglutathione lyase family enzyme
MIETKGIVHFTISVSDPDKSEVFYREVLGLETVQIIPPIGMVFMRSGDDFVILTKSKTPVEPNPGDEFFVHHAFRVDVDKYDASKQHLADHGVEIIFEEERHEGVFTANSAISMTPTAMCWKSSGWKKSVTGSPRRS